VTEFRIDKRESELLEDEANGTEMQNRLVEVGAVVSILTYPWKVES
jgi:hypothetical protein